MEREQVLRFTPIDHPDTRVQRAGFELTDPYVEQCWSAIVGPSATLLMRRMPALWIAQVPAESNIVDLSRSLGLGAGTGERSRLANTLNRLVRHGLARPSPDSTGFDVHVQVAPLNRAQLERVPRWTRDTHDRLLGAHIAHIGDLDRHLANVASITARLDRIQNSSGRTSSNRLSPRGKALGR